MLIPTYTIRFSSSKKFLGIAYAEFETSEQADSVCKMHGKEFKGRPLLIRLHVPMNPEGYFGLGRRHLKLKVPRVELPIDEISEGKETKSENETICRDLNGEVVKDGKKSKEDEIDKCLKGEIGDETQEVPDVAISPKPETTTPSKHKFACSKDTIFISNIGSSISDDKIREWFKDYSPDQIYIFRTKKLSKRKSFTMKGKSASVFVQVQVPETETLEGIIAKVGSLKLCGKFRSLKPAFKEKLQLVVDVANKKEQDLEVSVNEESKVAEPGNEIIRGTNSKAISIETPDITSPPEITVDVKAFSSSFAAESEKVTIDGDVSQPSLEEQDSRVHGETGSLQALVSNYSLGLATEL